MSDITARVIWKGDSRFTGISRTGFETPIDGDARTAASPVDLLLEAIGSCAAVDVVQILDKMRTPVTRLEVTIDADRHSPEPRYLTRSLFKFDIWGDSIKPDKASRAIQLSIVKYCTVFNSLRTDMEAAAELRLHSGDEDGQYIAVALKA
jgi:putative redox protein